MWSSLSKTDLLFLAARLRKAGMAQPERSPAIAEYLRNPPFPEGAGALGPALPILRRNFGSGLVELAPYEDAAAESSRPTWASVLPIRNLPGMPAGAEGLPAEALGAVVEPAALAVLEDFR